MVDVVGAVSVEYWAAPRGGNGGLIEPAGIEQFKSALRSDYVARVQSRPGALGGLYGLTVEFFTSFSLHRFLELIADGVAYDLIKSGADALVLRPFLAAYKSLRSRNLDSGCRVHIDRLSLKFEDSVVTVHALSDEGIPENLERIIGSLVVHYPGLTLASGERPFWISIPVVEDPAEDRIARFREVLDYDETIKEIHAELYFGFWGLEYDYAGASRVYDLGRQILLDEGFYTQTAYWRAYDDRLRRERDR